METDTCLIEPEPIIAAAKAFEQSRESSFVSMATTAKAAINYGQLLTDARDKLGSGKKLETWLLQVLPDMPIQDSEACLKVAAKFAREGEALFLQRSGAAWAQAELGLLPPPPPKSTKGRTPYTATDALEAIERCKTKLADILAEHPLDKWTEQERTLFNTALAELDMIGGDK